MTCAQRSWYKVRTCIYRVTEHLRDNMDSSIPVRVVVASPVDQQSSWPAGHDLGGHPVLLVECHSLNDSCARQIVDA
jgi:hypothetical protein